MFCLVLLKSAGQFTSVLIVLVAYFLGSIPFGYLIVRARRGQDVRKTGSGGTGATNVSRSAGKGAGLLTLTLDVAKGFAAIVLTKWLLAMMANPVDWRLVAAAGVAVIAGHIFPIWLGFRGGKGVATGLGAFLALSPLAVAGSAVVFFLLFAATRYVSLGSIIGALSLPIWFWLTGARHSEEFMPLFVCALMGSALITAKHHANIARLLSGTESRFK